MNQQFVIAGSFLKNATFELHTIPELFFSTSSLANVGININVQSKKADFASAYWVDVYIDLEPYVDDKIIFSLHIEYTALTNIIDNDMDEDALKHILGTEVPQNLYDSIRGIVWNITSASGFPPIMLNDYNFTLKKSAGTRLQHYDENENSCGRTETGTDNFMLCYEYIVHDIVSDEEGKEFMEIYRQFVENIYDYESQPFYKYYLRFLEPIEYHHPDYAECHETFWPLLFQFIFTEADMRPRITEGRDGLPELEFIFNEECRTVSSLSPGELKEIISELGANIFAIIGSYLLGKTIDDNYSEELPSSGSVLKEELLKLYCCDSPTAEEEDTKFVDKIYARIKDCDLQTFAYKI